MRTQKTKKINPWRLLQSTIMVADGGISSGSPHQISLQYVREFHSEVLITSFLPSKNEINPKPRLRHRVNHKYRIIYIAWHLCFRHFLVFDQNDKTVYNCIRIGYSYTANVRPKRGGGVYKYISIHLTDRDDDVTGLFDKG